MDKKLIVNIAVKLLVVVLLIVVIYWAVKKLSTKIQGTITNVKLTNDVNQEIDTSAVQMTNVQMQACVSKLKEGFYSGAFGWAEDEAVIYSAFEMIPTRSDLLIVMRTFGVYKDKTLVEHIASLLSRSEIDHINEILHARGINYSF